jgi:hypothetical protein
MDYDGMDDTMTNQANKQSGVLRRFGLAGAAVVAACLAVGATFLGYGVDANLPWPVTSNTTIAGKYCGGTVLAGTGSTGFFTVTVPGVSGFPSNCVVTITNGDITACKGKSINFNSARFILWPGQTTKFAIINGAWVKTVDPGRWTPICGGTPLIVNTDITNGSDTIGVSDGLGTGTEAFKTVQAALQAILTDFNFSGTPQTQVKVLMAAGSTDPNVVHFTTHGLQGGQGGAVLTIDGNGGTLTGGAQFYFNTIIQIRNVTLSNASGSCLIAVQQAYVEVNDLVTFGSCAGAQISISTQGTVETFNNFTIAGGGSYFLQNLGGKFLGDGVTATVSASIAYSGNTIFGFYPGLTNLLGMTWTLGGNTVTGNKYDIEEGHLLLGSSGVPGTVAGSGPNGGNIDGVVIPPNPTASTLGGIESIAAIAHQWIDSISTVGAPHQSQPAFSDLSGTPTTLGGYGIAAAAGIDENILNTQISNYSVAATDCGKTIQLGTGSTGQFTLTLPAVTGFPSNCSVLIKNGDSTNAKFLSGFPSDLFAELFPGQSAGVKIVNGAWQSFYNPGLWVVSGPPTLYVNGNSATTNAATSAGNNTLHFASTPSWITAGVQIADVTTPAAIPSGTTVLSTTGTTAVLSANVAGAGVGNGDVITASATCGTTGASTCGPGSDANDCLQPATACLTAQKPLNLFLERIHSGSFNSSIILAHASTPNYAVSCENGPFLGTSIVSMRGDNNAKSAVTIVPPSNGVGVAFKDGCTLGLNSLAFANNVSNNAVAFIIGGNGQAGHLDAFDVSFGAITSGAAISVSYGSSVAVIFSCPITGSMANFLQVAAGGVIDFSGSSGCAGSSGLTFSSSFAYIANGGIVTGVQALSAGSPTFTGFSGVSGPRCQIDSSVTLAGLQNPNSVFPGSSDCVPISFVGTIGVPSGSGASSTYAYGNVGQALCSSGASSVSNNYCNPIPTTPSASTLGGVESIAAIAHQWIDSISTSGVPHQSQPATTDLSDVTAPTAWTATDGSGAGLTFTVNAETRYVKNGKTCVVSFMIQWPSTTDTNPAQISGIPAACTAHSGTYSWVAGGAALTGISSIGGGIAWAALQTGGTSLFFFGNSNQLTNANMSGGIVRGTITYITN